MYKSAVTSFLKVLLVIKINFSVMVNIYKKIIFVFAALISFCILSCKTSPAKKEFSGYEIIRKAREAVDPANELSRVYYLVCQKEVNPSKIDEILFEKFLFSYKNEYVFEREMVGNDKISNYKYDYNITSGKIIETVNGSVSEVRSEKKSKLEFIFRTYMNNLFFSIFNNMSKVNLKGKNIIINNHKCYKLECLVLDAGKPGKQKVFYYIDQKDFLLRKVDLADAVISSIRYRKYSNTLIPYKYIFMDDISGKSRVTISRFLFKAKAEEKEEN